MARKHREGTHLYIRGKKIIPGTARNKKIITFVFLWVNIFTYLRF